MQGDGIGMQWLVELTCPRPSNAALAIVLDVSDSCGPMRNESAKVPRLVAHLPRDMPIWLYRLSNYEPSNKEKHRVAHLQDGSLQLSKWLDESRMRDVMAMRGSLLRPVLESIVERKTKECLSQVKLLVLTDGELLDVGELNVPDGIDIIGLATSSFDSKCKNWRRVLPRFPIFDLLDPRLDDVFADVSTLFYGACEVSWGHAEVTLTATVVDLTGRRSWPVDTSSQVWNSVDQSLMLVLKMSKPASRPPTLVCRSIKRDESIELQLTSEIAPLDAAIVAEAFALLNTAKATKADVILNVCASDPQFEAIRSQFLSARSLALSRESWVDSSGIAKVWNGDVTGQALLGHDDRFRFDALLCLANLEPADRADAQIMVFALDKKRQPAIELGADSLVAPVGSFDPISIRFDTREARWMFSQKSQARELDPRFSQVLELPMLALFSGPLR